MSNTRLEILVAIALVLLALPSLIALIPFGHDVTPETAKGEDWLRYHRYAVSVADGGLHMPGAPRPYYLPGGFGYVYFVAAIYRLFGIRSDVVYATQVLLAIAALVLYVRLTRDKLGSTARIVFAASLVFFAAFDVWTSVWPQYHRRLLSENLLLPLLAIAFWIYDKFLQKPSWSRAFGLGVVCGLCFLVRPNTALMALAWAPLLKPRSRAVALLAGAALAASLLAIRDHAAGSDPEMNVVTTTRDWLVPSSVVDAVPFYARRVAYAAGVHSAMKPMYSNRIHWVVATVLAVAFLVRFTKTPFDFAVLAFLAAYYVPLIAVAHIASYGYRMFMPAMPLVFYLAARYIDSWCLLPRWRGGEGGRRPDEGASL